MSESRFVVVSGIIGVGKTTLAQAISERMGWRLALESVDDNPYLPLFYADMDAYALEMQMYLLNRRFAQHQEIVYSGGKWVQDRSIYEDVCFALMLEKAGKIKPVWRLDTYKQAFENMTRFMVYPDLVIMLEASPETCLRRIAERDRTIEIGGVTADYLMALQDEYDNLMDRLGQHTEVWHRGWGNGRTVKVATDGLIAKLEAWDRGFRPDLFDRRLGGA